MNSLITKLYNSSLPRELVLEIDKACQKQPKLLELVALWAEGVDEKEEQAALLDLAVEVISRYKNEIAYYQNIIKGSK